MRNDEVYEIDWDTADVNFENLTADFFGEPPEGTSWAQIQRNGEPCQWNNLEEDMKRVSARFPETLFTVMIRNYDTNERYKQYHKGGRYYEVREVSVLPKFNETLLR